MNLKHTEIYFIKAEELEFLLAASGMESWYGIPVNHRTNAINAEDINTLLAGLYQKDYIRWEGSQSSFMENKADFNIKSSGEINLQEPVASMVRIIRDAGECLKLEYKEEGIPVLMVYLKEDQCVLLEESPWDKSTYRFRIWTKMDLEDYIRKHSWQIKNARRTRFFNGRIDRRKE